MERERERERGRERERRNDAWYDGGTAPRTATACRPAAATDIAQAPCVAVVYSMPAIKDWQDVYGFRIQSRELYPRPAPTNVCKQASKRKSST